MKCTGTDRSVSQAFQDTGMSPHVVSLLLDTVLAQPGFARCSPAGKNQKIPQIPPHSRHPEDLEESLRKSLGLEPGIPKERPGSRGRVQLGERRTHGHEPSPAASPEGTLALQPGSGRQQLWVKDPRWSSSGVGMNSPELGELGRSQGLGEGGEHHTQNWEWLFLGQFSAWRATKGIKWFNMGPVLNEEAENPQAGKSLRDEVWGLWQRGHRGVPAPPGVPLLLPSLELGWNHFPRRGHCFPFSSAGSGREGRGEGAGITTRGEQQPCSSCLSRGVALPRF